MLFVFVRSEQSPGNAIRHVGSVVDEAVLLSVMVDVEVVEKVDVEDDDMEVVEMPFPPFENIELLVLVELLVELPVDEPVDVDEAPLLAFEDEKLVVDEADEALLSEVLVEALLLELTESLELVVAMVDVVKPLDKVTEEAELLVDSCVED